MSYDIKLTDPVDGSVLHADQPHHIRGGTYAVGGTTELWLNVTYNYGQHFHRVMDAVKGIRVIYGMTGEESIRILKQAIQVLGTNTTNDYWEPTEGNARQALCELLAFAQMRPNGVWSGD